MTPSALGPQIERYLLGQLPPRERDRLETLLFEDDAVSALVEHAEDELIDRYLGGQLSPSDQEAFERYFAAPLLRQERIAFRRALPRALALSSAEPRASAPSGWPRPAWVGLAAVLVAAVWLVTRPGIGPGPSPGGGPASPSPVPPRVTEPSPAPALVLRPGLLRGAGALLRLEAPSPATLALDLEPGFPSTAAEFAIALRTVEGADVWRGSGRRSADGSLVRVLIPGAVLRPGDYTLSLTLPAAPSPVSEYPLRVVARADRRPGPRS
jgi:hypothetical protein